MANFKVGDIVKYQKEITENKRIATNAGWKTITLHGTMEDVAIVKSVEVVRKGVVILTLSNGKDYMADFVEKVWIL